MLLLKNAIIALLAIPLLVQLSCTSKPNSTSENEVFEPEKILVAEKFDSLLFHKKVGLNWIKNEHLKVAFTNYGARIVGLWVRDKNNHWIDVVVGPGTLSEFVNSTEPYFGATIGRVGNRIANGKFQLNGKTYTIPKNNGENTLHGGFKGFQDVVWEMEVRKENEITFGYTSPHMEEGFPGTMHVKVTYQLTDSSSILISYQAETDQETPVNLTNHAFFNLNGEGSGTILNHMVQFAAEKYTPVDKGLIPLGYHLSVKNTPFDFITPHSIGERIGNEDVQLTNGMGYDHNFVVDSLDTETFKKVATVAGDKSGIVMEVYSQEPGLQFYSGNFMQSKNTFKSGAKDDFRTAFALETQHFPDAPNQTSFPSIFLKPGEKYTTKSEYKFSSTKH